MSDALCRMATGGAFELVEVCCTACGSIGYDQADGPTQYFKIGHYRAPVAATTTLNFDDFRRGDSRKAIEN